MARGTFGNIRLKNRMVASKEGSFTRKLPEDETVFVYEAAAAYGAQKVPLLVLAGREYGTGSSRDWAAKGPSLLGVKAVLAESFERIHRSNLVGMGVLPLTFKKGESYERLGLDGTEVFFLRGIEKIQPRATVKVTAIKADGDSPLEGGREGVIEFEATARLDTAVEVAYFENNGILPYVLRKMLRS